jgi:hypothetical protein
VWEIRREFVNRRRIKPPFTRRDLTGSKTLSLSRRSRIEFSCFWPVGCDTNFMSQPRSTQTARSLVTSIHKVEADGVRVFYRAAGDPNAPVVLLLHGFPTSSFMFRELIPRLATHYRVIAPDLPGFGFTEVPGEREYVYSFDRLAATLNAFTQALKIRLYALYVFAYGAPVGLRLAMAHPDRVTAMVSQNGNAYEEGLGDAWGGDSEILG